MLFSTPSCVALAFFFATAAATVLRLPITDHFSDAWTNQDGGDATQFHDSQRVIFDDPTRAPVMDVALIVYGLEVDIGNPPQTMKVLLDIEWDTFFVQSSSCQTSLCKGYNHTGFNYSVSTSYIPSDSYLWLNYANANFEGSIAQDTLNMAGLEIPQQTFLDATDINPSTFFHWYIDYSGVLGFSPGHANHRPDVPSPWEMIVSGGALDQNVFSISPPTGNRDFEVPRTNGELVLGGLPRNFPKKESITLPLKFAAHPWSTSLETVSYGDELAESFKEGTAYFSTSLPYILLPGSWAKSVLALVGPTHHNGFFEAFPCDIRKDLPSLTFGIGGQNITLTAFQYTFEMDRSSQKLHVCSIAVHQAAKNTVGLGWPFMENFHMVFNQDKESIMRMSLCYLSRFIRD